MAKYRRALAVETDDTAAMIELLQVRAGQTVKKPLIQSFAARSAYDLELSFGYVMEPKPSAPCPKEGAQLAALAHTAHFE